MTQHEAWAGHPNINHNSWKSGEIKNEQEKKYNKKSKQTEAISKKVIIFQLKFFIKSISSFCKVQLFSKLIL